ncbi:hypothetical protein [Actinomadura sp. NEAU-AAG7]|uniref:hypothetical protein n=1 Tax=Actinomadura sp. NEAU-AAG7 TaxID=2839640 RepID=UPI001BE4D086|nr:hypothetical protein [Actinomadura sp. NEAU-AAG7]MBT2207030.1 hypothetical protein [Actinomadura sp. NEAU-AAG7]
MKAKEPDDPPTIQQAAAAYMVLMDNVVPESQYWQGKRENVDTTAYLGSIIERHAARKRAERRAAEHARRDAEREAEQEGGT